jgi:hypothetical protein
MRAMDEVDQAERREWSDENSSMTLVRVPPRLGILKPTGRVGEGAANFWSANFEWILTDDMLLFFDGGDLGFASADFISIGSSMTTAARPRTAEFHVLVNNVMIGMIAKTINMSMGGFMTIYRQREAYEVSLARALELQK